MAGVNQGMLVVNPGSSTIKYVLFGLDGSQVLSVTYDRRDGHCERTITRNGETMTVSLPLEDFGATETGLTLLLKELVPEMEITYMGFRVVHGGFRLTETSLVTPQVMGAIREAVQLAPLHNPVCIQLLEAWERQWPSVPRYAVFDTAFHATIPEHVYTYALPKEVREATNIRRYGFHGISFASMARQVQATTGSMPEKIIACHLGSGSSVCAIKKGKSIDTSMGTTPLEGLVMSTRVGDIDPGSVLLLEDYLAGVHADQGEDAQEVAHEELETLLYKKSGLLGLAGTHDMREILRREAAGDADAALAINLFCYHVQKYIGSYYAILGGCDALFFGGGIGQGAAAIRERILAPLAHLGLVLDLEKNKNAQPSTEIADNSSTSAIWVLDPQEAQEIFVEVTKCHSGSK